MCRLFWAVSQFLLISGALAGEPPVPRYVSLETQIEEAKARVSRLQSELNEHETVLAGLRDKRRLEQDLSELLLAAKEYLTNKGRFESALTKIEVGIQNRLIPSPGLAEGLASARRFSQALDGASIQFDRLLERHTNATGDEAETKNLIQAVRAELGPIAAQSAKQFTWLAEVQKYLDDLDVYTENVLAAFYDVTGKIVIDHHSDAFRSFLGEVFDELMKMNERARSRRLNLAQAIHQEAAAIDADFRKDIERLTQLTPTQLVKVRSTLIRYIALTAAYPNFVDTLLQSQVKPQFRPDFWEAKEFYAFFVRGLIPFSEIGLDAHTNLPYLERVFSSEAGGLRWRSLLYSLPVLSASTIAAAAISGSDLGRAAFDAAPGLVVFPILIHLGASGLAAAVGSLFAVDELHSEISTYMDRMRTLRQQKKLVRTVQRVREILKEESVCQLLLRPSP